MSEVEKLDINPRLLHSIKKLQLTTLESILQLTSPHDTLSTDDLNTIKLSASKALCKPEPLTALQLVQKKSTRLTTGCTVLDQALGGGILCTGITEISGESATGKTQFGLQLSLTAQLSLPSGGLDSGTLYICTEDAFPSKRLYQMIQHFSSGHGNTPITKGTLADKIFIEHVSDFDGLMDCITRKASVLLSTGRVRLIVVDSVAAHFRSDYEGHEMYKRAKDISAMATALHKMSLQYDAPVICINQVTSAMTGEGKDVVPALGLAWSNHVTTRLMLSRTQHTIRVQQGGDHGILETVVREMDVVFAPHLPNRTVQYVIDFEGMKSFK